MADDKKTQLSIVLRTVDQATAKIKAVNDRLDAITKPVRDFKKALGELKEKSGFNDVIAGAKGVGSAIGDLLSKAEMIGGAFVGAAGVAAGALIHLIDSYDDLGKKASRLGVGVDFLAQMRFAAEKTGVAQDALDDSLLTFNQNLGQARAGTGRMYKFLGQVSPVLRDQVVHAKNNAAAFDLIAQAMAKVTDPAKRAALAQKVFGDSALAPLFARGAAGIKALREQYSGLAGSQEGAATASEETKSTMVDLHAATDGMKAALVEGLAPALADIVKQLSEWFVAHRQDVREWAADIGKRIPAAIQAVVEWLETAYGKVRSFIESVGGIKVVALAIAAVMTGPLIAAIVSFGIALTTMPFGLFLVEIAGVVAAVALAVKSIQKLAAAGRWIGEKAAYAKLVQQHMDEIRDLNKEAIDEGAITEDQIRKQAEAQAANDIATSHAKEDADDKRAQDLINGANAPAEPGLAPNADVAGAARTIATAAVSSLVQSIAAAIPGAGNNKLVVEFKDAPRGTRAKADPRNTSDVDLSIGYAFGGGG